VPELRKDPVTGRWVIISTDRQKRPNDFRLERSAAAGREHCPFCPGHEALTPSEVLSYRQNGGAHEVIIETPDHDRSLALMSEPEIERVLWAFRERMVDLRQDHRLRYILVFKNHGAAAGATLEHPHSQLIALPIVPDFVREELDG